MRQTILCIFLACAHLSPLSAQDKDLELKISELFFDIPYNADINATKKWLSKNPAFEFYKDPNRDAKMTIVGSFASAKDLNPIAIANQLIIAYTAANDKRHQNVSIKWTMHYELEDLPAALTDLDKIKSRFVGSFNNIVDKTKIGQQNEQIISTEMEMNDLLMTFKIIQFNNFIHTISVEYNDVRKIKADESKLN